MYGTIFTLTERHHPDKEGKRNIPSMAIDFSNLSDDMEITADVALEIFKSARKTFKLIRGREFEIHLKGRIFLIDRYGKNFVIYELKEGIYDATNWEFGLVNGLITYLVSIHFCAGYFLTGWWCYKGRKPDAGPEQISLLIVPLVTTGGCWLSRATVSSSEGLNYKKIVAG
jgi:hypothetical protein